MNDEESYTEVSVSSAPSLEEFLEDLVPVFKPFEPLAFGSNGPSISEIYDRSRNELNFEDDSSQRDQEDTHVQREQQQRDQRDKMRSSSHHKKSKKKKKDKKRQKEKNRPGSETNSKMLNEKDLAAWSDDLFNELIDLSAHHEAQQQQRSNPVEYSESTISGSANTYSEEDEEVLSPHSPSFQTPERSFSIEDMLTNRTMAAELEELADQELLSSHTATAASNRQGHESFQSFAEEDSEEGEKEPIASAPEYPTKTKTPKKKEFVDEPESSNAAEAVFDITSDIKPFQPLGFSPQKKSAEPSLSDALQRLKDKRKSDKSSSVNGSVESSSRASSRGTESETSHSRDDWSADDNSSSANKRRQQKKQRQKIEKKSRKDRDHISGSGSVGSGSRSSSASSKDDSSSADDNSSSRRRRGKRKDKQKSTPLIEPIPEEGGDEFNEIEWPSDAVFDPIEFPPTTETRRGNMATRSSEDDISQAESSLGISSRGSTSSSRNSKQGQKQKQKDASDTTGIDNSVGTSSRGSTSEKDQKSQNIGMEASHKLAGNDKAQQMLKEKKKEASPLTIAPFQPRKDSGHGAGRSGKSMILGRAKPTTTEISPRPVSQDPTDNDTKLPLRSSLIDSSTVENRDNLRLSWSEMIASVQVYTPPSSEYEETEDEESKNASVEEGQTKSETKDDNLKIFEDTDNEDEVAEDDDTDENDDIFELFGTEGNLLPTKLHNSTSLDLSELSGPDIVKQPIPGNMLGPDIADTDEEEQFEDETDPVEEVKKEKDVELGLMDLEEVPERSQEYNERRSKLNRIGMMCCVVCLLSGVFILGSFAGATLALERGQERVIIIQNVAPTPTPTIVRASDPPAASPTILPTEFPTPLSPTKTPSAFPTQAVAPTAAPISSVPGPAFDCPPGNSPLEFRITFDASPGQIGVRVFDSFGTSMWNFPVGAFGSISLLLQENILTLCLSPFQSYTFEVVDSGGNGLVSSFVGNPIYGSFRILYEEQLVTSYNGDCSIEGIQECGNYCRCTYQLLSGGGGSTGQCTTNCTQDSS